MSVRVIPKDKQKKKSLWEVAKKGLNKSKAGSQVAKERKRSSIKVWLGGGNKLHKILGDENPKMEMNASTIKSFGQDIIDGKDKRGRTPLVVACKHGQFSMVTALIEAGASIGICNDVGQTPLHVAIRYGHYDIAKYLLLQGADLSVEDKTGHKPFQIEARHVQEGVSDIIGVRRVRTWSGFMTQKSSVAINKIRSKSETQRSIAVAPSSPVVIPEKEELGKSESSCDDNDDDENENNNNNIEEQQQQKGEKEEEEKEEEEKENKVVSKVENKVENNINSSIQIHKREKSNEQKFQIHEDSYHNTTSEFSDIILPNRSKSDGTGLKRAQIESSKANIVATQSPKGQHQNEHQHQHQNEHQNEHQNQNQNQNQNPPQTPKAAKAAKNQSSNQSESENNPKKVIEKQMSLADRRDKMIEFFGSRADETNISVSPGLKLDQFIIDGLLRGLRMINEIKQGDIRWVSRKAGGHDFLYLKVPNRPKLLLKPLQSKERGRREVTFFETVARIAESDDPKIKENNEIEKKLKKWIPNYYGVVHIGQYLWIIMEDVTGKFKRPSILDLKMGRRTYQKGASQEKRSAEVSKYPQQLELGFRVTGMNVFKKGSKDPLMLNQTYGQSLTIDNIHTAFENYFDKGDGRGQSKTVKALIQKLEELLSWIGQAEEKYSLVASSLLIMYDSDTDAVDVRIIDFGNLRMDLGKDGKNGFSAGVQNVIGILNRLLIRPTHTSMPQIATHQQHRVLFV